MPDFEFAINQHFQGLPQAEIFGAQGSAQFAADNIINAKKAFSAPQFAYVEGTLE